MRNSFAFHFCRFHPLSSPNCIPTYTHYYLDLYLSPTYLIPIYPHLLLLSPTSAHQGSCLGKKPWQGYPSQFSPIYPYACLFSLNPHQLYPLTSPLSPNPTYPHPILSMHIAQLIRFEGP